ncbi:MAG: hypothetical protein IJ301_00575 [Clostridia bacterium]|nr:hypothetical protein [Clostridia bacterium]
MASGFSQLGGVLDGLIDSFTSVIVDPIINFINDWLAWLIHGIFYGIQIGLFYVMDVVQGLFRKVAGLDTYYSNNEPVEGDIVFSLFQDPTVQATFISILVAGIFLLFITTFIAVLKTEFDEKDNAKGPVFKSALKAIAYFAIVPIVCLLGVYVSNVVLKMLDGATSRDAHSFSSSVFTAAAFDANRARADADFAKKCYQEHKWIPGMASLAAFDQEKVASLIDQAFRGNYAPVATESSQANTSVPNLSGGETQEYVIMYNDVSLASVTVTILKGHNEKLTFSTFSQTNLGLVYYFYDPLKYNYIIGYVAAGAVVFMLLNLLIGVIQRIFELCVLFVLSPAAVALMPLDGGDRYKAWRGMFVKRVFSAYGPILGLNLVFMVLTLISNITFFPPGGMNDLYNSIVYLIIMFTALVAIRSLVDLVTELVGQGDALKQGEGTAKDVMAKAQKVGGIAANGAMMPVRMVGHTAINALNKRNARSAMEDLRFDAAGNVTNDQSGEAGSSSRMLGTRFLGRANQLIGRKNSASALARNEFHTRRQNTMAYLAAGGKVYDSAGNERRYGVGQHKTLADSPAKSLENIRGALVDDDKIQGFFKGFGKGVPIASGIAKSLKDKKEFKDAKDKVKLERKAAKSLDDEAAAAAAAAQAASSNSGSVLYSAPPPGGGSGGSGGAGGSGGSGGLGGSQTTASGGTAQPQTGQSTNTSNVVGGTPTTMAGAIPVTIQNTPTVTISGSGDEGEGIDASFDVDNGQFVEQYGEDAAFMSAMALNVDADEMKDDSFYQNRADKLNTEKLAAGKITQETDENGNTYYKAADMNVDANKTDVDSNTTNNDTNTTTTTTDSGEVKAKIDDEGLKTAIKKVSDAQNRTRDDIISALNSLNKEVQKTTDASKDTASVVKGIAKVVGKIGNNVGNGKTKSGKNKR